MSAGVRSWMSLDMDKLDVDIILLSIVLLPIILGNILLVTQSMVLFSGRWYFDVSGFPVLISLLLVLPSA